MQDPVNHTTERDDLAASEPHQVSAAPALCKLQTQQTQIRLGTSPDGASFS